MLGRLLLSAEPSLVQPAVEALGRSQRERTSRFIKSEETGDLVLKINNYTLEEGEKSEEARKHTEFFDVCNNLQKTDEGKKKKRHRKVVAASD